MPTWLRMVLVPASVGGGFTGFVVCTVALTSAALPPSSRLIAAAFAAPYAFVVAAGLLFVHHPATRLARMNFIAHKSTAAIGLRSLGATLQCSLFIIADDLASCTAYAVLS